jgi:tetratricopeptide (TPR) repeat protein
VISRRLVLVPPIAGAIDSTTTSRPFEEREPWRPWDAGIILDELSNHPRAVHLGALFHNRTRDCDGAIAAFRQALALEPTDAETHTHLGNALSGGNKLDEAIAAYQRASELEPSRVLGQDGLGDVFSRQDKWNEANAWYRKAIELDPKCPRGHSVPGIALEGRTSWTRPSPAAGRRLNSTQ